MSRAVSLTPSLPARSAPPEREGIPPEEVPGRFLRHPARVRSPLACSDRLNALPQPQCMHHMTFRCHVMAHSCRAGPPQEGNMLALIGTLLCGGAVLKVFMVASSVLRAGTFRC